MFAPEREGERIVQLFTVWNNFDEPKFRCTIGARDLADDWNLHAIFKNAHLGMPFVPEGFTQRPEPWALGFHAGGRVRGLLQITPHGLPRLAQLLYRIGGGVFSLGPAREDRFDVVLQHRAHVVRGVEVVFAKDTGELKRHRSPRH